MAEMYNRIMDKVRQELEAFEERIAQRGVDERTVKSIARAVAGQEVAKLHGIVREELDEFKAEVEEKLSKYGIDPGFVEKIVNEISSKLLSELDKRFMHVLDTINEQSSSIKDVLDLVNEILKAEVAFEEELAKLRSEIRGMFSEERLEEVIYKTMIKRGIIRRKWVLPVVGLGILAAVATGFLINPAITFVILAVTFVVLLRW